MHKIYQALSSYSVPFNILKEISASVCESTLMARFNWICVELIPPTADLHRANNYYSSYVVVVVLKQSIKSFLKLLKLWNINPIIRTVFVTEKWQVKVSYVESFSFFKRLGNWYLCNVDFNHVVSNSRKDFGKTHSMLQMQGTKNREWKVCPSPHFLPHSVIQHMSLMYFFFLY